MRDIRLLHLFVCVFALKRRTAAIIHVKVCIATCIQCHVFSWNLLFVCTENLVCTEKSKTDDDDEENDDEKSKNDDGKSKNDDDDEENDDIEFACPALPRMRRGSGPRRRHVRRDGSHVMRNPMMMRMLMIVIMVIIIMMSMMSMLINDNM